MIYPRPMPSNVTEQMVAELRAEVEKRYPVGTKFELIGWKGWYVIKEFAWLTLSHATRQDIIRVSRGPQKTWCGLFRFYCNANVEWKGPLWGFAEGEKLPVMAWMISGVDGTLNVDRLAEAAAKNGEIMPRLGTEWGDKLAAILKEVNEIAVPMEKTSQAVFDRLDHALLKYGTTIEALSKESGLIAIRSD